MDPHHPLWLAPLPSIHKPFSGNLTGPRARAAAITHADYFQAVRSYVTGPGRGHVERALAARGCVRQPFPPPERIAIILEKHGEFYHPSRLVIDGQGGATSLVLNVAVTPAGRAWMSSEMAALVRVAKRLAPASVPAIYGQALISGPGQEPLGMFLADWFDDFHEFHLSIDPRQDGLSLVVWDTTNGPFFLSGPQQAAVYRQAARLLTRAYDPVTTDQIYPWHHASGDFVLRTRGESMELRLITVRQYAPTMQGEGPPDADARLTSLLVFFLNLTLRNRIDRLNGTGDPAWAGPLAVPATVAGVFQALDREMAIQLRSLLAVYSAAELIDALGAVADRYRLMPMEQAIIRANLAHHGALLHETLGQMPRGG